MKKYVSYSFFSACIVGLFAIAGISGTSAYSQYYSSQGQGGNCPSYYHPVCGEQSGNQAVYQNICTMNAAGASFVQWKSCGYASQNYTQNYTHNWNYQRPVYTQPVSLCSQDYNPVCASVNGYKKSYSNACFARKAGADFLNSGACKKRYVQQCVTHSVPQCGYNQKKVFKGYDSNGCNTGYKCVQKQTYYTNSSTYNTSYNTSCNSSYNNYNSYNSNYSNSYNNYNNSYYQRRNVSFSISRLRNNVAGTITPNTVFTVNVYSGQSGSTITHFIPEEVEFLGMKKGSCQKTRVYGGTQLKCHNVDSIRYTAKSSYASCRKKFTTTFSNYNYNNQYRTFALTVK